MLKSVTKERITENGKISHFDISDEDMKELDSLDECLVTGMSSNYSPGG